MEMIDIEKLKNFYNKHPLQLCDENVDFDLLDLFVHSRNEIDDLVLDIINHGKIKKQTAIKFNYKDTKETQFVLVEKDSSEINISLIIEVLNENNFRIVSIFPTVKNCLSYKDGAYFPDYVEAAGRVKSAIGLQNSDFFDPLVLFERNYFEDDNSYDSEWNVFGIAYPFAEGTVKYNDSDGMDAIYPFRKIKIRTNGIESVLFNGILFYKCYTDAALFVEYDAEDPEVMGIKIPIYISEKIVANAEDLYNGKEMSAIIFGSIKTE